MSRNLTIKFCWVAELEIWKVAEYDFFLNKKPYENIYHKNPGFPCTSYHSCYPCRYKLSDSSCAPLLIIDYYLLKIWFISRTTISYVWNVNKQRDNISKASKKGLTSCLNHSIIYREKSCWDQCKTETCCLSCSVIFQL